jgi:hypothetical protein
MKMNCWEFKKCGREPGGNKNEELGICTASIEKRVQGVNNGKNAGRCCWAIAGTLCGGQVQGTFSLKMLNCMECDFYKMVYKEEANRETYKTPAEILRILGKC